MFSYEQIEKEVKDIIRRILVDEERQIMLETSADLHEIGMDSLNFMNLIVKLEMRFGIEVNDDVLNMNQFNTVEKISNHILDLLNK